MRILSIDGGGIRGIIPAMILARIEAEAGEPISKLFDLIAGTSTGGLIALGLAMDNGLGEPKFSAEQLVDLYKSEGKKIFRGNIGHSITSLGSLADEKYDNSGLRAFVGDSFGEEMLSRVLTEVIVTAYETERRIPWFFKSKNAKVKDGYDFKLRDVALATSAAPTYFEAHKVTYRGDNYLSFIDGGIYANNPALCAYIDAKTMFKEVSDSDITLVSLGTGQLTTRLYHDEIKDWGLIRWARPVLNCVFDGCSDTVHYQLSKILTSGKYYRFQEELVDMNEAMDDVSERNIRALELVAENIIHENEGRLCEIAEDLKR